MGDSDGIQSGREPGPPRHISMEEMIQETEFRIAYE
jgi:hypothetical protein